MIKLQLFGRKGSKYRKPTFPFALPRAIPELNPYVDGPDNHSAFSSTGMSLTFDSEVSQFVLDTYREHSCILEYGSGGSTVSAAKMEGKTIICVESDPIWLCRLNTYLQKIKPPSPPITIHIDIGATVRWGYPADAKNWEKYPFYPLEVWRYLHSTNLTPDVVLIDGRFRAACFIATVCNIRKRTRVLFDDYEHRDYKSIIERFYRPDFFVNKMAVFDVSSAPPNNMWNQGELQRAFYDPH